MINGSLERLQIAQVDVAAAVIAVIGWTSVNGLVVVIVGPRAWVALFGFGIKGIVVA